MPTRAGNCRAVFDLAHLATLSGEPGLCLCVSEKTLYILQNLVITEVQDLQKYSVEMLDDGYYIPCQAWMDCYADVLELIEGVETEVISMPCYAYTGIYSELKQHTATENGVYSFDFEVPENELWEFQALAGTDSLHDTTIGLSVINPGEVIAAKIKMFDAQPLGKWACWDGKVVLSELQKVRVTFYTVQTGDFLAAAAHVAKLVLS